MSFNFNIPLPLLESLQISFEKEGKKLAETVGVRCNGVAIGTFARNIIEEYIDNPDFYNNIDLVKSAYIKAKELVTANIGEINE